MHASLFFCLFFVTLVNGHIFSSPKHRVVAFFPTTAHHHQPIPVTDQSIIMTPGQLVTLCLRFHIKFLAPEHSDFRLFLRSSPRSYNYHTHHGARLMVPIQNILNRVAEPSSSDPLDRMCLEYFHHDHDHDHDQPDLHNRYHRYHRYKEPRTFVVTFRVPSTERFHNMMMGSMIDATAVELVMKAKNKFKSALRMGRPLSVLDTVHTTLGERRLVVSCSRMFSSGNNNGVWDRISEYGLPPPGYPVDSMMDGNNENMKKNVHGTNDGLLHWRRLDDMLNMRMEAQEQPQQQQVVVEQDNSLWGVFVDHFVMGAGIEAGMSMVETGGHLLSDLFFGSD